MTDSVALKDGVEDEEALGEGKRGRPPIVKPEIIKRWKSNLPLSTTSMRTILAAMALGIKIGTTS